MAKITLTKRGFMLIVFLSLFTAIGFAQSQTFNSDGLFTVPSGVTSVTVEAWGAGGAGGTRWTSGLGGGGGGGAYARKVVNVTPGNTYTVEVGSGATGTLPGGDSWFINNSTILAKGGSSVSDNNAIGANGGSEWLSIGDVKFAGGDGGIGFLVAGGGGGSSAGINGAGNSGGIPNGGSAPAGGGDGGDGMSWGNGNGYNGSTPGGGGGGAVRSSGTRYGGYGANGQVIISWASAEISVSGNSVNITDGDTTPTTADHTNFGSTEANSGTLTRTFTIENSGSGTLTIGAITITGTNAGDFTVISAPAATVANNDSTTFTVEFTPSAIGPRNATINIANNDANENPFNFSILGTGTVAEINVQGNNVNIVDGDTTPSTADFTDFGATYISGGTVVRTFTIQNLGTSTGSLSVGAINISGTHASDFTVTASPASVVGIGNSTTFSITFNPSGTGVRTASVSIVNSDSNENPYDFNLEGDGTDPEIDLRGNGATIIDGDITPSVADHTDFGTTDVASGTITRTFTIRNVGTATGVLNVGAITINGLNTADFSITALPAATVNIGSTTTFEVTFNPTGMGTRTANINIANNDSNENPYSFYVRGFGADSDMVVSGNGNNISSGDITPSVADNTNFGAVDYMTGTISQTFTIQNTVSGTLPLTLGAITFSGANAADFTVTSAPAAAIAVGGSTTFTVTFNPSASGARNATISIISNDGDANPYTFALTGTGTDPEINIQGNSTTIIDGDITPSTIDATDFGPATLNGSTIKTYTIQNNGNGPLTIGTITISGANAADFTVTAPPAAIVPPAGSTTFSVTFSPSALGIRNAMVSVANNDVSENPYNFSIRGTGADCEINVTGNGANILSGDMSPSLADFTEFGTMTTATGTIARTFTIQNLNTATAALTVGAITVSGPNAADFTISATPAPTVAVNGSTNFTVTFNPSGVGNRNATITIVNSDSNENPYVFAIRGTGIDPEINIQCMGVNITDGDITPSLADHTDFGTTDIAVGTIVQTFTVQNLAMATSVLNLGAISITGVHAADFTVTALPSPTVAIGGSTTFEITFNPGAIGVRSAILSIVTNDSNENPYNFFIRGTGSDPEINVVGNGLTIVDGDVSPSAADHTNFGNTEIAAGTTVRTFTIENLNTAQMPLTIGAITVSGTNPGDFIVGPPAVTTIGINSSTTFTVTFNPSALGTRSATINIANNDSNENPYNFAVQGTGTNPELNVIGNLISITDGDTTPSVSDNTDFGTVSIDSGSTLVTYTIQNTGIGTLNIGAITFSGANAADFSVVVAPPATLAQSTSATFTVEFNPSTVGAKTAMLSIENDDSNENPYNFAISGFGVRTYPDTDGDGVSDNIDLDDDNDGILDTLEELNCITYPFAGSMEHTFLNETFGAGTTRGLININIPGATCTYCFEDGIAGPNTTACPSQSSWILDDGEYTVVHKIAGTVASDPENIHGDLAWNGLVDHTPGDTNGRMAVFNASYAPGIFYETTINGIIPNVPITYSFWAMNILSASVYSGSILPNITVEFLDMSNNILSTFNTGDLGRCNGATSNNSCGYSVWKQFTTSVNLGNNTSFRIRFKNNAPGGGGNDLALDDITIKQQYCDRDADGIANIFDLDSDNDGIPDIEEAGFAHLSAGMAIMDLSPSVWLDANANGLHDSIDAQIAAGTYALPDFDGDGINDIVDLDSDNDGLFDIDEAGLFNGDGDIDGDGTGDGPDSDFDGVLDIFDTSPGYGTQVRPFAQNTDGTGNPDYLQSDSNNDGAFDIATTLSLYGAIDANNDGEIDGTADIDKDGIIDTFDSTTLALGSPRNINKKLFLEFDGRNDYAEGTQLLSGRQTATIMGWIKLANPYSSSGFVLGQDNFNIRVNVASGNKLVATAKGISVTFGTNLSPDRWYHVAAVYNGSHATEKLKLYVNGRQEVSSNSGGLSGNLGASALKFTIGKNAASTTDYFKGSIDEVRVFNTALTDDQLQKMVYQEIKSNGSAIRGEIIPKDIDPSSWASLLAYYRMDAYKGDVIDNYTTPAIDAGSSTSLARIYNVKNIYPQLAPMPFETTMTGTLEDAVSQNNFVHGLDVLTYDWTIVKIKHDIKLPFNHNSIGLFVDPGVELILNDDNVVRNSWYVKLDGVIDLEGRSQLVQTIDSDLDPTSAGYIERDQQGQTNHHNYNYWCSPVGSINTSTNNTNYTVAGVMKDGTNPANPQNIQWTSGVNGSPTTPITLSSYWIFKFQNVTNDYANWASVGPNGTLMAAQGFTLKGSNAATPTQNYTFIGKPNSGAISSTVAANNLNLSGNPYPSALDSDAFITRNLSSTTGTLYFWEHFATNNTHTLVDYQGGYAVRTLVGGAPPVSPSGISGLGTSSRTPGRFIPVGQAFFLTGSATGGTINFDNAQRAFVKEDNISSNVMFRQNTPMVASPEGPVLNNNEDIFEEDTNLKLRLGFNSPNNYHRQVLLGYMEDKATAGIDPGYDAIHIDTQPNDMYFMKGSAKLIIMGEGYFNEMDIFPIGIKTSTQGNVSFVLDGIEHFDESQDIFIHDNLTGLYHDIKSQPFVIEMPSGTNNTRFSLRFTNPPQLDTEDLTLAQGIHAAYNNDESIINIKNNIMEVTVKSVLLYNMLGQAVASEDVANQNQQQIKVPVKNLAAGTYIVKMVTTKGDVSTKIVIR